MADQKNFEPFRGFTQVAYVTTDYEKALEMFAKNYGVSEWLHMGENDIEVGENAVARLQIGLTYVGDLQLELIQPKGGDDAVYRSPLPESGFAVRLHHLAQMLETDSELDAAHAEAAAGGVPIVVRGSNAGGLLRYFYTDHWDSLGHYIEHIWYAPEVRPILDQIPRN